MWRVLYSLGRVVQSTCIIGKNFRKPKSFVEITVSQKFYYKLKKRDVAKNFNASNTIQGRFLHIHQLRIVPTLFSTVIVNFRFRIAIHLLIKNHSGLAEKLLLLDVWYFILKHRGWSRSDVSCGFACKMPSCKLSI